MIRPDAIRKHALALPGAEERPHWGDPCYRVRGRIFAVVHPREKTAVLKLAREDQSALVAAAPDVFGTNAWSHQGWTIVDLRRIEARELYALVDDAWRQVAGKRAVAAFDAARSPDAGIGAAELRPPRASRARGRRSATTDG